MNSREWERTIRGMDRRAFLKQSALAAGVLMGGGLAGCSSAGGDAGGATGEALTDTTTGTVRGLFDNECRQMNDPYSERGATGDRDRPGKPQSERRLTLGGFREEG